MGFYRTSRNIEASLIDFLRVHFELANWSGIAVEKSFAEAQNLASKMNKENNAAVICVRASDTNRKRAQIGTDSLIRSELVLIDVFATSDGQRLDLVDFLIDELKSGFPYFEYQTDKSSTENKIQTGRVTITSFDDKPVNFGIDKSNLEVQDRFRHLISLTVSTGKIED
jgi:hypothetical protein